MPTAPLPTEQPSAIPVRPRRSVLFVPAANPRALEKSRALEPDVIIFDLEDSASIDEKEAARERLREHLLERAKARHGEGEQCPEIVVRINPLASAFGTEDFLMARGAAGIVGAILLPKVEAPGDLRIAADALAETDAPETLGLWAMIETPLGILRAAEIAASGARVRLQALVAGPNDIATALHLRPSPGRSEMAAWLSAIVLAARAYGLDPIDGVFNALGDAEGFGSECAAGRAMGFCGKTLIHPSQIAPANAAFAPTRDEIAGAEAILAAFALPENAGKGVVRLEGSMVERLHLLEAQRLLAFARAIAAR